MSKELKIGLALAGGGARGAAHIGVLQVLRQNDIPIHAVAGSSAGAVMGAMYAATLDPDWMEQRFKEFLKSDVFKAMGTNRIRRSRTKSESYISQIGNYVKDRLVVSLSLARRGIVDRRKLANSVEFLLPVRTFEELKTPLKVIATDLNSGAEHQYSSGNLIEAVVQSASIPGYVTPLQKDGQFLMDGGVSSPLPVDSLSDSEIDFTVAVDIARREMKGLGEPNMLEIMARSEQITSVKLADELASRADFVIRPKVRGAHWSEFDRVDEFIQSGREAANESLSKLKGELERRKSWTYRLRQRLREVI